VFELYTAISIGHDDSIAAGMGGIGCWPVARFHKCYGACQSGSNMEPELALILSIFGLPSAVWPYKIARFEERLDGIGSRRSWSEIEPADWKVGLTRVIGIGMTIIGVLGIFAG
jgi:hypothetical protein